MVIFARVKSKAIPVRIVARYFWRGLWFPPLVPNFLNLKHAPFGPPGSVDTRTMAMFFVAMMSFASLLGAVSIEDYGLPYALVIGMPSHAGWLGILTLCAALSMAARAVISAIACDGAKHVSQVYVNTSLSKFLAPWATMVVQDAKMYSWCMLKAEDLAPPGLAIPIPKQILALGFVALSVVAVWDMVAMALSGMMLCVNLIFICVELPKAGILALAPALPWLHPNIGLANIASAAFLTIAWIRSGYWVQCAQELRAKAMIKWNACKLNKAAGAAKPSLGSRIFQRMADSAARDGALSEMEREALLAQTPDGKSQMKPPSKRL